MTAGPSSHHSRISSLEKEHVWPAGIVATTARA
jgi:hypothetical protein